MTELMETMKLKLTFVVLIDISFSLMRVRVCVRVNIYMCVWRRLCVWKSVCAGVCVCTCVCILVRNMPWLGGMPD